MNKVFLTGNLTHDPQLRTTQNGVSVCNFAIAVQRRVKQGEEKKADFFQITAWREIGETCARYLAKGKKVAVVGELQTRTYQAQDGSSRVTYEVQANEVEFLSPRETQSMPPAQGGYAQAVNKPYAQSAERNAPVNAGFTQIDDDELPF